MRWFAHGTAWAILVAMLGLIAYMVVKHPILLYLPEMRQGGPILLLAWLGIAITLFAVYRRLPRRFEHLSLVLEAEGLRYEAPSPYLGRVPRRGFAPWSDVYLSKDRLLVGNQLIGLVAPWLSPLLAPEDEMALRAAVPGENHLSAVPFLRRAWKARALGGPLVAFAITFVVVFAALRLVRSLL